MIKHPYFTRAAEKNNEPPKKDNKRKRSEEKKSKSTVTINKKKPDININVTINDSKTSDKKRKMSPQNIGMNSSKNGKKRSRDESDDEYENEESDVEESNSDTGEKDEVEENESENEENSDDENDSEEAEEDYEDDDNEESISTRPRKRQRTLRQQILQKRDPLDEYIDSLLGEQDGEDTDYALNYGRDWKKGLSKAEIKKLEPLYINIQKAIKDEEPSVAKILESSLPFKDKCRAMELFELYKTMYAGSMEAMEMRRYIHTILKQAKPDAIAPTEEQTKQDEKLEKELTAILKQDVPIRTQILQSKMPQYQKALLYEKFLRYDAIHPEDSEKVKMKESIEWTLSIPHEIKPNFLDMQNKSKKDIQEYLCQVQTKLDSKLFGMRVVKEEILLALNNMISNPASTGHALALVGPPGVGKTEIVRALADALDMPFEQISLGGVQDSSYLDGHSYTYKGAQPGAIVKALKKMKYKNGIIFFDEFDKLADTEKGKEVSSNLLHITDFTQNCEFRDNYLDEIRIDLSHIWFIYSLNDPRLVDDVLRDRIPMIKTPGYNFREKIEIAKQFLIPKAMKNVGLEKTELIITDEIIGYIISKSKMKEEGVRQLNRNINSIVTRVNLLKTITVKKPKDMLKIGYAVANFKVPFVLEREHVDMMFKEASEDKGPPEYMYV